MPLVQLASKDSWESDAAVKHCRQCSKSFGLVTRRSHCRLCGRIFCGECVHGLAYQAALHQTSGASSSSSPSSETLKACQRCIVKYQMSVAEERLRVASQSKQTADPLHRPTSDEKQESTKVVEFSKVIQASDDGAADVDNSAAEASAPLLSSTDVQEGVDVLDEVDQPLTPDAATMKVEHLVCEDRHPAKTEGRGALNSTSGGTAHPSSYQDVTEQTTTTTREVTAERCTNDCESAATVAQRRSTSATAAPVMTKADNGHDDTPPAGSGAQQQQPSSTPLVTSQLAVQSGAAHDDHSHPSALSTKQPTPLSPQVPATTTLRGESDEGHKVHQFCNTCGRLSAKCTCRAPAAHTLEGSPAAVSPQLLPLLSGPAPHGSNHEQAKSADNQNVSHPQSSETCANNAKPKEEEGALPKDSHHLAHGDSPSTAGTSETDRDAVVDASSQSADTTAHSTVAQTASVVVTNEDSVSLSASDSISCNSADLSFSDSVVYTADGDGTDDISPIPSSCGENETGRRVEHEDTEEGRKSSARCSRFLKPNEAILKIQSLSKTRYLMSHSRVLVLTNLPRIFYVDESNVLKGSVTLDKRTTTVSVEGKKFVLKIEGKKDYNFTAPSPADAESWSLLIKQAIGS